jgi:NADP-dependent 3-hydroxy-3-methylglutaryl-CoA reductase
MHDRREQKRYENDSTFKAELGLGVIEEGKKFPIHDLSEHSLSVVVTDKHAKILKEGTELEDAPIFINNEFNSNLQLKIVRVTPDPTKKELQIVFAPSNDPGTTAAIWEIIYNYHFSNISTREKVQYDVDDLPRIPGRGLYTEEARQLRLKFARENTSSKLEKVAITSFDPQKLTSNIEAFIGSIEIPVGIAGPLIINGMNANGIFYAPMATSEGALVASVSRGAIAISKSGGTTAHVIAQRMLRAPLFCMRNMTEALFFAEWIRDHFNEIKEQTKKYSNYANLVELSPTIIGRDVHIQFVYETGDAAGQNMTTTCTWNTCKWIFDQMLHFKNIQVEQFLIDGSLSNDKRVTHASFIKGRGIRVMAEVFIPEEILVSVLKVTTEQLLNTYQAGLVGCIQASMIGVNVNVANVIAAMFASCGQDIASVHESSLAHFHIERAGNGIYATMIMPCLVIGTVGGGTNLAHQRECLEMIGCAGPGKSFKLAEIIASYCLALDLSTSSAIASGQFASAHERLGRNRLVNNLKLVDINDEFVAASMRVTMKDESIKVFSLSKIKDNSLASSILTKLTSDKVNKLLGLFPYAIEYESATEGRIKTEIMIKIKPTDKEVDHMHHSLALICDARLAQEVKKSGGKTGSINCHIRELEIFKQTDPRFTRHVQRVYGIYRDDEREAYVLLQERLKNMELMDSADDVSGWTRTHIEKTIDAIAEVHSIWYGREEELKKTDWIGAYPTLAMMKEHTRLWELLGVHAVNEFPEWFKEEDMERYRVRVNNIPEWWGEIEKMPKTLIHNDFNPRNIAFRKSGDGPVPCIYDWELATLHLPQHDCAELLVFVLNKETTRDELLHYVEFHRKALERYSGKKIDKNEWWKGFQFSTWDFLINRYSMYMMAHTVRDYGFMERTQGTLRHILDLIR